ncbi:hypothetical protein G4Y79_05625 [Phototrophicus methaneseepsis]|uniref:Uncharacterized protein n=1 Tax=Phototrophicus methaneseepsis TaxID=2710758 RepID=A0A7S8EBH0_9CHLR|nr:hypothetical protein [Phototrophicus methaneseepsis]QPC83859.1 hypothetical protein G4Y79_05625 [Phototrophicus methaneseepsis]
MFKRMTVLCILLLFSAAGYAQNDSRDFNGYRWYDDGISFTYPLSVAEDAIARFTPATADTPEEVKVIFQNYHNDEGWLDTGAEISVIPASSLRSDISYFSNLLADFANGIEEAQQQLINPTPGMTSVVAQVAPLDFQTGSGVRFVLEMQDRQGASNISYRFIGMTADDGYLISAIFPFTAMEFKDIAVSDAQSLDILTASDFTPDLTTLDALIGTLSVTPPATMILTTQANGDVSYGGIAFAYDPTLAYRVEVDAVEPITGAEAEQSMFGATPGYTLFSFVGYPTDNIGHQPQMFVMPVSEFPAEDQPYGLRLGELQNFLAAKPELHSRSATSNPDDALPILPILNAAQTIVSQPEYLRFGSGEGVRYIAYYSQSAEPLTANDLFYVYTGLSDDGQYVVSAIFPLFAGFLPQGRTVYEIADIDQFMMNYRTYLDGVLLQINVMDSSAYSPNIQLLDALVASITVH